MTRFESLRQPRSDGSGYHRTRSRISSNQEEVTFLTLSPNRQNIPVNIRPQTEVVSEIFLFPKRSDVSPVTHKARKRAKRHIPGSRHKFNHSSWEELADRYNRELPEKDSFFDVGQLDGFVTSLQTGKEQITNEGETLQKMLCRAYDVYHQYKGDKNSDVREKAYRVKLDVIRLALETSPAVRGDDLYLIAIGPVTEEGNIVDERRISQYAIFALFYHRGGWRMLDSNRATLAATSADQLANNEQLHAIDQLVTKDNVLIWEEGMYNTYNRQIAEMESIGKLQQASFKGMEVGYTSEELKEMKLLWLASTLALGVELQATYGLANWYVRPDQTNRDKIVITFRTLVDTNMIFDFFERPSDLALRVTGIPYEPRVKVSDLLQASQELEKGNISEENRAASQVLDLLYPQLKEGGLLHLLHRQGISRID